VHNTSEAEYYEYIVACKELGYIIEMDESSIGYGAYDEDGYHLKLGYYNSSKEMSIELDPPTATGEINWIEHEVSAILPMPKSTRGIFSVENDEVNTIIIGDTTKNDFEAYCEECKIVGFTIDSESDSRSYAAYDSNGNKVSISHEVGNKEMKIVFEYPMICTNIIWPIVGVGTLAPVPNSLSGKVGSDYDWAYSAYLENTSWEEYQAYVQKCIDAGFSKDIRNYEKSVWADYSKDEDITIHVTYEGFNIMYVHISGSVVEDYSSYTRKQGR